MGFLRGVSSVLVVIFATSLNVDAAELRTHFTMQTFRMSYTEGGLHDESRGDLYGELHQWCCVVVHQASGETHPQLFALHGRFLIAQAVRARSAVFVTELA